MYYSTTVGTVIGVLIAWGWEGKRLACGTRRVSRRWESEGLSVKLREVTKKRVKG